MSDGVHLLIPFAGGSAPGCVEALARLRLPRLQQLLARLGPESVDEGAPDSLSLPHERVLARAAGLPLADGLLPLAAWQLRQEGREPGADAWAWITPCHVRVGADHLLLLQPQQLQLEAAESQAFAQALAPWFAEDGLTLEYQAPLRWLARGELFRQLPTASLDRVAGRSIEPWLGRGADARPLRRLQQEMQMFLYTHPLNDERQARGLLPLNSFWASGGGALPAVWQPQGTLPQVADALREPALAADWSAWVDAWQQLDARTFDPLLAALARGQEVRLTLGGERAARTWSSAAAGGALRRLARRLHPPALQGLLDTL